MDNNSHILVIEDNPADVFLIQEIIETIGNKASIHVVKDGEEAIRFFGNADRDDAAPCPGLVILDINLPKRNGVDVLQHIRQSRRSRNVAIIVVSSSDNLRDREAAISGGANAYFRKPSEYDKFMKLGDLIAELFPKEPSA